MCDIVIRRHGEDLTRVTGVGYFSGGARARDPGSVVVPTNPAQSYVESLEGLERCTLNYSTTSRTFAFHNACWEVLLKQLEGLLDPSLLDLDRIVQHLFNLFYCIPWGRSSFSLAAQLAAHDFGGATRFWKSPANIPGDWQFLWAEPRVPCWASARPVSQSFRDHTPISLDPHADHSRDCFLRLPEELIDIILELLPSPDVCNCRLASRTLAGLADPRYLPPSFWCSRFLEYRELGFLCVSLDLTSANSPGYWENLYHAVKAELQDRSGSGHLRNRDRIWRSLRHITDCLVPLIEQNPSLLPPDTLKSSFAPLRYVLGPAVGGQERIDDERGGQGIGINALGACQILLDWQHPEATTSEIKVSFIAFNGTEYVCGLRYVRQDGSPRAEEISRAGVIMPSSEITFELSPEDNLSGIRVAATASGIIGMALLVQRGQVEAVFSAGLLQDLPQGAGLATLRPRVGRKMLGVAIGFDVRIPVRLSTVMTITDSPQACKFISVQLIEQSLDMQLTIEGQPEEQQAEPQCSPVHLQHPTESLEVDAMLTVIKTSTPLHPWLCTLPQPCPFTSSQPYLFLHVEFGGPDGARLSSLIRVVAYLDDGSGSIKGFAFHFMDGTRETCGMTHVTESAIERWACTEQSVAIDGPGGERITGLEYILKTERPPRHDRVETIRVSLLWLLAPVFKGQSLTNNSLR